MKSVFLFLFLFVFCFGITFAGTVPFRNGTVEIPNDYKPLSVPESSRENTSVEGAGYFNDNGNLIMLFSLNVGSDVDLDSSIVQELIYKKFKAIDIRTFTYAGKKILTATANNDGEVSYLGCFVKNGILYLVHFSERNNITNKKIVSPFGKQLVFSIINSFSER